MDTQTTTKTRPIGQGYSDNYPCICIQDYETNKWVWFNVYEIFQNSNDLEEFTELMKKARKSVCRDEWFYSDCLYLNSIYFEHIDDSELFDNTKEFAEHHIAETENLDSIPYIISSNIDYENVWYDLQHDFVEIEADGKTYFFRQ